MSRFVCTLALSLLTATAWAEQGVNPHIHASTCFPKQVGSCDYSVCLLCHTPSSSVPTDYSTPWSSGKQAINEAYQTAGLLSGVGDIEILCAQCHNVEMTDSHSGSNEYKALLEKLVTVTTLLDSKAADPCALRCTTCHDPHSREPDLLRFNIEGSVSCLTCHLE
jgi:hypothetical protein